MKRLNIPPFDIFVLGFAAATVAIYATALIVALVVGALRLAGLL